MKLVFGLRIPRGMLLILLLLFGFLGILSLMNVYFTHQLPTEEERSIPLGTYRHVGNYNYTAKLKPNNIYNKTTLTPGEGTLYIRLTEYINTTLSYNFILTNLGPANITTEYTINTYLASSKWSKQIDSFNVTTVNSTNTTTEQFSFDYRINVSTVQAMARTIESEIGTSQSDFNVTIRPSIHTVAITSAGTINEQFNPSLTVGFKYKTAEGEYISITGLQKTNSGVLTQTTKKLYLGWVILQRYASYASSLITFSVLALVILAFRENKPPAQGSKEPSLKDIIAPFKEIIVEAAKESSHVDPKTTITMKSLEDLAKVAEWLGKPILHSSRPQTDKGEEPTDVFYVLDDLTKYEYTVTALRTIQKEDESDDVTQN